jgi:ParB/RepB/Spo0J family partition protein
MAERAAPEYRELPLEELRPFEGNPRRISPEGIEKIKTSIETFGQVAPIIIQRRTNVIIAGHQRLKAMKLAGVETAHVLIVDLDDDEAHAYNIADNRLSEESAWDDPKLAEMIDSMSDSLRDATGFAADELARRLGRDDSILPDGEQPKTPIFTDEVTCPSCGHVFVI